MEFATRLPTIPRLKIEPVLSSILNQKLPSLPTPSSHNLSDYSYSHRRSSTSTQGGRSGAANLFADSRSRNRTQDPRTPPPDMANPTVLQRWNALGQIETVCPREGLQGDGIWVPSISPGSQQPQHNTTGNPSSISVYAESNEELPPQPKRRSSSTRNNGAMMVPEEIIPSKKAMAEFAAEVNFSLNSPKYYPNHLKKHPGKIFGVIGKFLSNIFADFLFCVFCRLLACFGSNLRDYYIKSQNRSIFLSFTNRKCPNTPFLILNSSLG